MSSTALHFLCNDTNFTVRAIALIISQGRLLVAKSDHHDCFYTVGGVVQPGESSAAAVCREVREETGLHLEIDRLVFVQERFFPFEGRCHHEIAFFYLMKDAVVSIAEGTQTDQTQEHLHWIPLGDLPNRNLVPAFLKTALEKLPDGIIHILSDEYSA